jgi:HlyD family secretion protein
MKLKPGMTAAVTIETAHADDVLKVPNAALRFRPTTGAGAPTPPRPNGRATAPREERRAAVWVLADGTPTRVPVKTGITDGKDTAILEGDLTPGALVITAETSAATTPSAPTTSPLLPGRRGGGPR